MCGRFTLTADIALLAERFGFDAAELSYTPSYNIAPGQQVLTVVNDGTPRAGYLRWGLVPSWAKDPGTGHRLINARAETVAEKPSFRQALRQRRCLVLADGFFEWQHTGTTKRPMYIRLRDHRPFAFAGLWDTWRDPAGTPLTTCTILTTDANALLTPIHQRMPVILPPAAEAVWLDRRRTAPEELLSWLEPYDSESMEAYAVSPAVNSPRHNAPECIAAATTPA
jgi:putative SOS response-associated peptidase YedK